MFMDGLRVGPARTQLFRVQDSTLEEAIQVASKRSASIARHARQRLRDQGAQRRVGIAQPPVDLSPWNSGSPDIRCYGCGRLDHMKRACSAGGQRKRLPPRPLGLKGRWLMGR
ncbi:hypothetical protein PC121_g22423 [Phytophthora cactorum]|nr:hypothetical protein PC120_g24173 [Phytophthora cactorum]KAG3043647.1 hypothetical protein PC121_g22423 [Phytophthora cactorum]KAG4038609.1 hypothetical protein PC123_g25829 [Phytophthora cactorum]